MVSNSNNTGSEALSVAIQGIAGCFHDAAARNFFADKAVTPIECDTFPDLFDTVSQDPRMYAVMAIENTIAGSILPNHELLRTSKMRIIGEYKMRISHVLCALPGQTLDSLGWVHSHPMALMQCDRFLRQHRNLCMVEDFDTAGSARNISRDGTTGVAAICGELAANLYGLEILEREIETNKHNFTRFLVLANEDNLKDKFDCDGDYNKASIVFTLPHTEGALSKILTIFSFYDMNLSKIQSMPLIGREWEYRFYVGLTFSSVTRFKQVINAVLPLLSEFKILGTYNDCPSPIQS